jgi:hypothetical protein
MNVPASATWDVGLSKQEIQYHCDDAQHALNVSKRYHEI